MTVESTAHPPWSTQTRQIGPALAIHSSFFLTGLITALLGPLLPAIRLHYGVSDAQAGSLFIAQFMGSSLGALFSQVRVRTSIVLGLALIFAGVIALPFTSWIFAHVAVFIFGIGLGLAIPATNMYVAQTQSHRRAASLNILNLFWGAGAAASPIIVAFLYHRLGFSGTLLILAMVAGAFCLLFVGIPTHEVNPSLKEDVATTHEHGLRLLLVFCLMLFLYIGIETSIGGWTASYVAAIAGISPWMGWSVAAFWCALLGGRALAPYLLRLFTERALLLFSLGIGIAGTAGMIATRSALSVFALAALTGWGLAPIFALIFSMMSRFADSNRVAVPGWLFSCAGMGGATLPWVVGVISTRTGHIRYGLFVPALATLALLSIAIGIAPDRKTQARG